MQLELNITKPMYSAISGSGVSPISRAFIDVYEYLSGEILPKGSSHIFKDEDFEPTERIETYGSGDKGLHMSGSPIVSGHGVHGESARWSFVGLDSPLEISGSHEKDMRKPNSSLTLLAEGISETQAEWLKMNFGMTLRATVGGDWFLQMKDSTIGDPNPCSGSYRIFQQ